MGTLNPWKDRPRDDDDGRPKFGRKARAWLARHIEKAIRQHFDASWHDEGGIRRLVGWYMQNPQRYVRWEDSEEYRGSGYSNGHWTVVSDAITGDEDAAVRECNAAIARECLEADAQHFPTLDDWLRADIAGELAYAGAEGGMPHAQRTTVPGDLRPKCRSCGKHFERDKWQSKNCADCIAAAKSVRRARQPSKYRTADGTLERGVYRLHAFIWAVTSHGEKIGEQSVPVKGPKYRAAVEALWDELDRVDPPREPLRIVK